MPNRSFNSIGARPRSLIIDSFSDLSKQSKRIVRVGLHAIGRLNQVHHEAVLDLAIRSIAQPGYGFEIPDSLRVAFGLADEELRAVASAATLAVMSISEQNSSADEFVEAATKGGVIGEDQAQGVRAFAALIESRRETVRPAVSEAELVTEVMPTLHMFETTVDLRVAFDADRVRSIVPVVLAHIDTDAMNRELWFQLSKTQVQRLIGDLQSTLRRIEQVEQEIVVKPPRG